MKHHTPGTGLWVQRVGVARLARNTLEREITISSGCWSEESFSATLKNICYSRQNIIESQQCWWLILATKGLRTADHQQGRGSIQAASRRGQTDSRGRDSPVKSERWVTLRRVAHQHGGVTRWWRRKMRPQHVGNLKPQKSVWRKRTNARNPLYSSSLHKHKMQNSHCQHGLRNIFWYKTVRPHLSHHYVSWQTALIHWAGPKYQTAPHGRTNGERGPAEQKVGWNVALFNAFNMNEKAAVSNGVGVGTYCKYLKKKKKVWVEGVSKRAENSWTNVKIQKWDMSRKNSYTLEANRPDLNKHVIQAQAFIDTLAETMQHDSSSPGKVGEGQMVVENGWTWHRKDLRGFKMHV